MLEAASASIGGSERGLLEYIVRDDAEVRLQHFDEKKCAGYILC
jgi:hypothetical protein